MGTVGLMIVPLKGGFPLDQSVGQVQFIVHTLLKDSGATCESCSLGVKRWQKLTSAQVSVPSSLALVAVPFLCFRVHLSHLPPSFLSHDSLLPGAPLSSFPFIPLP